MLPDTDKKPEKPLIIKMAGYLEKKGRMRVVGVRRWKKRWCVLEGKLLLYFKTQLEYSHHLSPCRGSVNMGLVLSVTPRGPCQLQIVTRSQIIIFRTKSKCEQDEWFAALRDAKHNNNNNNNNNNPLQSFVVKPRNNNCSKPSVTAETRGRPRSSDRISSSAAADENHLRYVRGPAAKEFDKIFLEVDKKNGLRIVTYRKLSALRKSESDNRISFYGETSYGLRIRTDTVTTLNGCSDKESCRSRSLSYESIYFKPQENGCSTTEPSAAVKSQSCRELAPCKVVVRRASKKCATADCTDNNNNVSKRMSRSMSFFQKRCEDSDSDDYDYVEITTAAGVKQKYSKPMAAHVEESELLHCPPQLPSPRLDKNDEDFESTSTVTRSEDFHSRESNIDVIYVNNDRRLNIFASGSETDNLEIDLETEQTVGDEEEPPPLPIKRKHRQNIVLESERQYKIAGGVYVFQNGAEEVIYDVPIPHGKLIEHFRRLTVAAPAVSQPPSPIKCYANNVICDDSLETSLYEALHMTPDSLEVSTMFPAYKRWSNDSGFNYEEPNSFSPDQTHFEDSLEPAIAMIHRDRKIWQNVPNINSTDYFR